MLNPEHGTCFPETSVDFQRTTRRYIPEDGAHEITAVGTSGVVVFGILFVRLGNYIQLTFPRPITVAAQSEA
jgi:hypothetical protein